MQEYKEISCEILGTLGEFVSGKEKLWLNECKGSPSVSNEITPSMVKEASARLNRFAPLIRHYFRETLSSQGIIESPLRETPGMKAALNEYLRLHFPLNLVENETFIKGHVMLKMDSHLPVSGSVKARGGIYEVLKHTEDLAISAGFLRKRTPEDILRLTEPDAKEFFAKHKIQVGSTGNLGLSIGIMSSALGYEAIVHMSNDAKQWKKDLLRACGAKVVEYDGDYGKAVQNGRRLSDSDPSSYFVDDENSRDLFCGYAVAGERVKVQLEEQNIAVDSNHPLFVYIPCGVGGAPGGIIYGLKLIYGNNVHCFLVEPTQAPCMLAGLASGLYNRISVQDLGLSGRTQADGLAVGRPSALVGRIIHPLLSGEATVDDSHLGVYLKMLWESEGIFIEPSACAAYQGIVALHSTQEGRRYLVQNNLGEIMPSATHILWATGGNMVPIELREQLL